MRYDRVMSAVDRLSVTVPAELGSALRTAAETAGVSVSAFVSRAIAREMRSLALGAALEEFDRKFGPVATDIVAESEALLNRAERVTARKKRAA
jgi:post-segregation antitoxin (ccd killing protein)